MIAGQIQLLLPNIVDCLEAQILDYHKLQALTIARYQFTVSGWKETVDKLLSQGNFTCDREPNPQGGASDMLSTESHCPINI